MCECLTEAKELNHSLVKRSSYEKKNCHQQNHFGNCVNSEALNEDSGNWAIGTFSSPGKSGISFLLLLRLEIWIEEMSQLPLIKGSPRARKGKQQPYKNL